MVLYHITYLLKLQLKQISYYMLLSIADFILFNLLLAVVAASYTWILKETPFKSLVKHNVNLVFDSKN